MEKKKEKKRKVQQMNSTLIWAQLLGFQLFFVFVVKKQILDPWFMCSCSRNSNSYLWVRESPGCKKKKKKTIAGTLLTEVLYTLAAC